MNRVSSIAKYVRQRPGSHELEPPYLVPNIEEGALFWNEVYSFLRDMKAVSPVEGGFLRYIDRHIGHFGLRPHPRDPKRMYYHIGVELAFKQPTVVTPIAPGVLEYSGYGAINGHYVLLSHPQVTTQDGYVLHSMYCHLKKPLVGFNSYQKMLREISLGSYPIIPIDQDQTLGQAGSSGVVSDDHPRLYLQLDFRKYGEPPIVVDPLQVLTGKHRENPQD